MEKLSCISSNPHNLSSILEHVTLHLLVGTLMFIDSDAENVIKRICQYKCNHPAGDKTTANPH